MNRVIKSSVISDVMWARQKSDKVLDCAMFLEVAVPSSMRIVLVGEGKSLGDWQPAKGVKMLCEKLPLWYVPSKLKVEEGAPYKFVIMEGDNIVAWESGDNRVWIEENKNLGEFRGVPRFMPRMAGVAIPVFSIRAAGCEGIGDFLSMGDFAEWAAQCGMTVVQTLPVNDTTITHTFLDSYPYKATSIYALHPLYIRVSEMDAKADVSELLALENEGAVDYEKVDELKWNLFRSIYKKKGTATLKSAKFKAFFEANEEWLRSYGVFSFLREKYASADYTSWPKKYSVYSERVEKKVEAEFAKEVGFYYFLQYHADSQLRAARNKARKSGVVFKGDIPIGVSRHSVEVWKEPHLFNLDGQAGAPPDDFSVDGQNWGFPTYNWHKMAADNYSWWKKRFEKMADYFDMYRIDHILGFFRIWEIPMPEKSGLMGHFTPSLPLSVDELRNWGLPMYEERYLGVDDSDHNTLFVRDHIYPNMYHPRISAQFTQRYNYTLDNYEKEKYNAIYTNYFYHRHNDFWAGCALSKLPALIDSTSMLCCAEDLGMIPDCVGWVLDQLQVATLEIQRMPKDPRVQFASTYSYPYRSVAASSTHDMNPIRGWWREDRAKSQMYYNEVMGWWGEAPEDATAEICRWIVTAHLESNSLAAILPWQDYMAMSEEYRFSDAEGERINVPSNPEHYWRYRMHLSVEELGGVEDFNDTLRELVKKSNR
ncbi:MAG: 4-alpha-glucanotransferase [Rikenellaceae bacterium]